MTYLLSI